MSTSHERILGACQTAFPDHNGLSARSVNPLTSNQHPMVVFFLYAEEERLRPLILRRYTSPLGWHTLDDTGRAAREFAVLRWLDEQGFAVPYAFATGCDDCGDWLLMGVAPGRNWWQPFGLVNFKHVLPGIVRQQVRLMARLHTLDPAPLRQGKAPLPVIAVSDVLETCQQIARDVTRRDVSDGALVPTLRRITDLMADDEERPARLVNVDAELANMLVTPDGEITAWLDWDQAALGDPRWDVAALVTSLRGAYQMADLAKWAASMYASQTLRPAGNLSAWLAFYAALRWVGCAWLVARIKAGHTYDFPSRDRFIEAYGSHRAWTLEMLHEAEQQVEGIS